MHKRSYLWAGGVMVGVFILVKTPIIASLFALIILGMIPGTALTIPSWILLIVYPILIASVLYWIGTQPAMGREQKATPRTRAKKPRRHHKNPARTKTAAKRPAAKRRSSATA